MIELMLRIVRRVCVLGMFMGICLPQVSVGQEDKSENDATGSGDTAAANPESGADPGEIDEIVVLGGRSLTLLRQEIIVAEDTFFDLYNDLNLDDRYDIICESRRPIGTRIRVRECKAQFVRDAELDATQNALLMTDSPANVTAQPIRASSKDYKILEEKLKSFAVSSPDLQKALTDYDNLSKKYSVEHEKKFD